MYNKKNIFEIGIEFLERHSEFEYCIDHIENNPSEIWLYIADNGSGWEKFLFDWPRDGQYDGPFELIKRIQENENWTAIKSVGELQYAFEEDYNHLMFQMNDLFGFVICIFRSIGKLIPPETG